MSVTIRTRPTGRDPVARSHRRRAVLRAVLVTVALLALVGGGTWLMFASSVFAVTEVRITGATPSVGDAVRHAVEDVLGKRTLGFLQPARNILLLDTAAVSATILTTFPDLASATVSKEYPHTLRIEPVARTPMGAWCRGDDCRFFDRSGVRWGTTVPSTGPLLLLVRDERTDAPWDQALFANLLKVVDGLPATGLHARTVTLPEAAPGDARVAVTAGYDVIVDVLGDADDQLSTLAVLLADKASSTSFRPAYIDLRTPGRVYYAMPVDKK